MSNCETNIPYLAECYDNEGVLRVDTMFDRDWMCFNLLDRDRMCFFHRNIFEALSPAESRMLFYSQPDIGLRELA